MYDCKRKKSILRIRSKFGPSARFEVLFLKTSANFYAQLNDLIEGKTIFSAGTVLFKKENNNKNLKSKLFAVKLSDIFSKYCTDNKIESVTINVANYKFHGLIKVFSENLLEKISSK